jgi:hypothetical protein
LSPTSSTGTKLESIHRIYLRASELPRPESDAAPKLLRKPQKFCARRQYIRQIPLTSQFFPCYPVSSQGA